MKRKPFFSTTLIVGVIISCVFFGQNAQAQVTPPSNLSVSIVAVWHTRVTWDTSAGENALYRVYRDDIAVATTSSAEYIDRAVTVPGLQHCYKVASYDSTLGYSDVSSSVCNTTTVGTASSPTNLVATVISSNSIRLDWTFSLTASQQLIDHVGRAYFFMIERSNDGGSSWSFISTQPFEIQDEGSSWSVTYTDTKASSGGSNVYRVTTLDWEVEGFSAPSSVVTAAAPQTESVPVAPSGLTFLYTSQPTTVNFIWKDNSNDETGWFLEKKSGDTWVELFKYPNVNTSPEISHSVFNLNLGTTYEVRARMFNSVGNSEPSNIVTVITAPDIDLSVSSNGVLCVYNLNLQISQDICNYYLQKRPGALSKGLDIPDSAFHQAGEGPTAMLREDMTRANFTRYVLTPLGTYVRDYNSSHAGSPIRYLAVAKGLPVRDSLLAVMPYNHHSANQTLNEYFRAEGIAASFLMGFTLTDIQKMIDKAQAPAPDLSSVKWFFDLDDKVAAGPSVIGDKDSLNTRSRLMSFGIAGPNVVIENTNTNPLYFEGTVVGYAGLGTHHNQDAQPNLGASPPFGYPSEWAKRSLNMSVANRAVIDAYESYYALSYHDRPQGQGLIAHAMTPTAFGGSNYSRSFAGGVGTVSEPGGPGVIKFEEIFPEYMKGHTWAQSFKNAAPYASYPMGMVVGDPIMTLRDGGGLITTRTSVKPIVYAGVDKTISGPTATLSAEVLNPGYPESHKNVIWTKQSGPGTATFNKRVSVYEGDVTPLWSTVTFSTAGVYVLRVTVSNGQASEYDELTITVTTGSDTTAPIIRTISPSETLASTATSASLSVTTDENAVCRYSTVSSTAFGASGSTLFGSTGEKTHTSTVSNLSAGVSYTYYVRCQDGSSNTNTVDYPVLFAVAALVQEVDTTSPSVSMTYPVAQQTVRESSIVLTASASDSGGISGVTFYIDGQSVGNEDTTSPYSKMVTLSEGSHRVHAVARDVAGNRATSGSVTFTVRITAPEQPIVPEIRPPVTNTIIDPYLLAQERAAYVEYLRSTSVKTTNLSDDKPSDKKSDKKAKELVRLSKNFDLGDEDPEIVLLQKTLNTLGYVIAEDGPGSKDNETSRFDEKTREALIRYQSKYTESGISATGELDNVTIVLLNKDIDKLVEQAELYDEEISAQNAENSSGFISSITSFIDSVVGGIADFIVGLFW